MAGTLDGHNIEVGSTPIDRLEEDIATQSELNDVITALNTEATTRANADTVLQTNINNLEASVNNNYVHKTGNIAEVITGEKTFNNNILAAANVTIVGNLEVQGTTTTIESTDLSVTDNIILLNNGETSDHVTAGISGIAIDRGTGITYRVIFDDVVDCLKAGFEGNEKCLATVEYVDNQVGTASGGLVALGTENFAGQGSVRTVHFTPDVGTRPYSVNITPKAGSSANIGDVWYEPVNGTTFNVYNTGVAQTGFDWSVGVVGILPAASGVAGGDLSGSYPDPSVAKIQGQPVATTAPLSGQALIWNGTAWEAGTSSGSPGGAAGGDLGGTYPNPSVKGLQGRHVSIATPSDGNVLTWNTATSEWVPQAPIAGGATDLNGLSDVTITTPSSYHMLMYDVFNARWVNVQSELNMLSNVVATPQDGDVLTYVTANSRWEAKPASASSGGTIIAAGSASGVGSASVMVSGVVSTDKVVATYTSGASNYNGVLKATAGNGSITISLLPTYSSSTNQSFSCSYVVVRP